MDAWKLCLIRTKVHHGGGSGINRPPFKATEADAVSQAKQLSAPEPGFTRTVTLTRMQEGYPFGEPVAAFTNGEFNKNLLTLNLRLYERNLRRLQTAAA